MPHLFYFTPKHRPSLFHESTGVMNERRAATQRPFARHDHRISPAAVPPFSKASPFSRPLHNETNRAASPPLHGQTHEAQRRQEAAPDGRPNAFSAIAPLQKRDLPPFEAALPPFGCE